MNNLPLFIVKMFQNYEVIDVKEWRRSSIIDIYLSKSTSEIPRCSRCDTKLGRSHGKYRVCLKHLPIFDQQCFIYIWREKRFCSNCKKVRSEAIEFISKESPHMTRDYSYWLGRMFEIASVKNVAEVSQNDKSTMQRLDFNRLKRMAQNYHIPEVSEISVDEVHARSKKVHKSEKRNQLFFTIITDLKTRKVVWVSQSRTKAALDEFFIALGKQRSSRIRIVAMDQHEAYRASVRQHCPWAVIIWDKFHLLQNFEKIINDARKYLHERAPSLELKRLTRGQWRFTFLKKNSRRTETERKHIKDVIEDNQMFMYLEVIKERFFQFFYAKTPLHARAIFDEIGDWIKESQLPFLDDWWKGLNQNWDTLKNYFLFPVTTALSEGINNKIKMLKRRGFGYRNMTYFRLKILQVCGFLNSKYVPMEF